MITYTEKGAGLHEAVAAAGHTLYNLDGVSYSDDDLAVQEIIDNYVYDPLADLEALGDQYIIFGSELAKTITAKIWAYHVYIQQTGTLINAQDLAAFLTAVNGAYAMLNSGALTQVQPVLTQIKSVYPQYTDIIDTALESITIWVSEHS